MKEYIINAPHLQSLNKRIGALFVWLMCWLMWIYLLVPLYALGSWVSGDRKMINEMRWFGGYKSLLDLLQIYGVALLAMALCWLCWLIYRSLRHRNQLKSPGNNVGDTELCSFFQINSDALIQSRNSALVTVYFDDHGHIVRLEPREISRGLDE